MRHARTGASDSASRSETMTERELEPAPSYLVAWLLGVPGLLMLVWLLLSGTS